MHTGSRDLLHLSKLSAFADWAYTQGYLREPTKGAYEVLRLRRRTEAPLLFWARYSGDHVTTDRRSDPLVHRWLKDRGTTLRRATP